MRRPRRPDASRTSHLADSKQSVSPLSAAIRFLFRHAAIVRTYNTYLLSPPILTSTAKKNIHTFSYSVSALRLAFWFWSNSYQMYSKFVNKTQDKAHTYTIHMIHRQETPPAGTLPTLALDCYYPTYSSPTYMRPERHSHSTSPII